MKKWMKGVSTILPGVLFLFAGYVVPQAVADETTVEFVFPPEDVSFQASDDGMSVQLREGTMPEDMPGTPWLPVRYVTIAVPSGAQIQRIDVQGEEILLRRDIDVIPVQPPQPLSQPRTARVPKDAAAYARADRIPVTQAVLTGTHTLRGYSLATVRLNPLRYVPAARELYLAPRLTVSVVYDAPKAALRAPTRHADSVRKLVQSLVVNPDALNAEPDLSATDELLLPDGAVDYLIITTGALTNAFQTLADHRAQFSGLSTRVMSVEEIAATYAGTDLQMQIRNCISNHYASMGTLYVVLGGDDTVVPDRDCYVECGPYVESQMPTDLYYSGLDGTWNADGDVIYGETSDNVDLGWDVIVGRIPVRTADQAAGYINKLMSCETNVPVELTHKILLGGALLWDSYTGTNRPSDNVTGDGHWGFLDAAHPVVSDSEMWSRRLYRDGIYPYWIPETVGIFSDTLTSWDTASGGDYLQNAANLRSKFNLGWYHTFFGTHGNVTVWGLESGTFSSSDAAALTNATMIVYTMACITGAFDNSSDPCLSEAFLRNPNGGALAYIGCSRYGWGSPDVPPASNSSDGGPSMQYGYRFYRRLYETNDVSVGMAFATHKADMAGSSGANGAYRWIQFGLNFQGDPAFGLPSQAQNLLKVTPFSALGITGYQGGPFTPSNIVYTLSNTSTSNLSWTAGCTSTWVTVSPAGGILAAGQISLVTVSINANANSLGAGTKTGVIVFSNVTSHTSSSRIVQLVVRPRVLDHFAWDPVESAQYVGQSIPVRIQAADATDSLLASFTNRVGLSGWVGPVVTATNVLIGSGINSWSYPMNTYWHDSRTQV
ncbi:MAG: C25 family cysteine peptidase, partial [Pontiellaceae bacterium]|nr:C25 family cysteine peptidase [Pontiellaceae bacterium]